MTRDAITHAAAGYRGWAYGALDQARERVDCCALLALTLLGAYQLPQQAASGDRWWTQVNVWDGRKPWSMLDAVHRSPGGWLCPARTGPHQLEPGRWHAVQGWQSLTGQGRTVGPGDRGHQLLWLASVDDPDVGWSLESQWGVGPCMRTAEGYVPLADALDDMGRPRDGLAPIAWPTRMKRYELVGWVVLPEVT